MLINCCQHTHSNSYTVKKKGVLYATVLVCPPHFFLIIFYSVESVKKHTPSPRLVCFSILTNFEAFPGDRVLALPVFTRYLLNYWNLYSIKIGVQASYNTCRSKMALTGIARAVYLKKAVCTIEILAAKPWSTVLLW